MTSPGAGATLANGTQVTVTGTAADVGGGVVTNVEVSLDAGATYHRATRHDGLVVHGNLNGAGASSIRVRANDDSANLSTPTSVAVTVTCPCSLFGSTVPVRADDRRHVAGRARREVHRPTSTASSPGSGSSRAPATAERTSAPCGPPAELPCATGTFIGRVGVGLADDAVRHAGARAPQARPTSPPTSHPWAAIPRDRASSSAATTAPLHSPPRGAAPVSRTASTRGGHQFPSQSYKDTNYWVDVLFARDDTTPPTIATTLPGRRCLERRQHGQAHRHLRRDGHPLSVSSTLKDAADVAVRRAPRSTSRLAHSIHARGGPDQGRDYTASVNALSRAGTPMPAPYTWSFTTSLTDPLPGICPCTIWPDSATPEVANSSDADSVQVGVKFTADVDGSATGVRFYKGPLNVGAHTGSIWTGRRWPAGHRHLRGRDARAAGRPPSSVRRSTSRPDTTYIVSYAAPNGALLRRPMRARRPRWTPARCTRSRVEASTPTAAVRPCRRPSANYWVDLVFMASDAAPTVASTSPADTSTNVHLGTSVAATLNGQVQPGTAQLAVKDQPATPCRDGDVRRGHPHHHLRRPDPLSRRAGPTPRR